MGDEAKLCSTICSTFEAFAVQHEVGCCRGEHDNWSVDQCWPQALQFSVHLIDLLSTLFRCNGFIRIQKAIVGQTSSRPPNSDHELFFGASLALGNVLKLLLGPATELVIISYHIKSTFHCTSQSN